MKITLADLLKNGIWLTFPPLLFSLSFMKHLPAPLTPALFNKGVSNMLLNGENIIRIFVFATPAFFSIGMSTKMQKRGLAIYLVGIALYFLSYGAVIIFPNSGWSTSMIGFTATAYINIFWMTGLGLLGERFYFPSNLRYSPVFYITPVIVFIIFHTRHAIIVYQQYF